jgi:hypothetical protein
MVRESLKTTNSNKRHNLRMNMSLVILSKTEKKVCPLQRSKSHNTLDLKNFQKPVLNKSASVGSKLNLSTYNLYSRGIFVSDLKQKHQPTSETRFIVPKRNRAKTQLITKLELLQAPAQITADVSSDCSPAISPSKINALRPERARRLSIEVKMPN